MRLLFTIDTLAGNGAERQMALTATNLPSHWDIRCFSVGGGPFADYLRERGICLQVVERRWHYDPLPFLRLWSTVARFRPDLVHSWGYMTTLAGFPIYRALGIPFIDGSIRTGDIDLAYPTRCKAGFNRASLVVANSHCGLASARVSAERGRVIPNGLDLTRIPPVAPPREDARFTVVMAARMDGAKDYASLFAAARLLVSNLGSTSVRFVVLGNGPHRRRLQIEGQDLVESGVLEFDVAQDIIPRLLVSDCGVLMTSPARVEGCSNAILEYMACGLPVVCSKGGGTNELVLDGETAFLVTPGNPRELADRLSWIYSHPRAARAMGRKGAEKVRRDYSLEGMVLATRGVYEEALRSRGRPEP
jgi:glycosyltransferase involved in cell wall biosynthesis